MLASIVVIPQVPDDNDDPKDWNFGKLRGDSTKYGYKAYVLSKDMERNLDIAPPGIDPLARIGWIGELMPDITKKSQQFDEEEFEEDRKEVKGYYSYGDNAIQILFYIDDKGLKEITNNGCSILIEETEYSNRNPIATSRHIIITTPKTK